MAILLICAIALIFSVYLSVIHRSVTIISTPVDTCKVNDEQFSLFWIHSIDRTPWIEYFERSEHGFVLKKSVFKTFGAGVPNDGQWIKTQDGMIHYVMNFHQEDIRWIVDTDVQSTIVYSNNNDWKIYQDLDRFTEIHIQNKNFNLWQYILMRNCYGSEEF